MVKMVGSLLPEPDSHRLLNHLISYKVLPVPHRLTVGVAGGGDDLRLGIAAHGAGVGHDAILGAGSRRGDLTVIPRVLAALRGAGHVVHPHYIAVLQLVSPQCGIDGLAVVVALNGHLPIDGEHPAGPTAEGAVAAGKAHAVGIGDTGEIGAADRHCNLITD